MSEGLSAAHVRRAQGEVRLSGGADQLREAGMKTAPVLDLQQAIDGQAFNKYHLRVLSLCALSVLMDGFDAQAMGFVAPTLSAEWNISRGALGPILTASLVGML